LISAYALTQRLNTNEAQTAIREYKEKCSEWRLYPEIREYYEETKYRDAGPIFRAATEKLLEGLQDAKDKAGFP
jgi:hypothetical protein